MSDRPTQVEIVRYIDGDLPARRSRELERWRAVDADVARVFADIEADIRLQGQLQEVLHGAGDLEAERRIEAGLSQTVVSELKQRADRSEV